MRNITKEAHALLIKGTLRSKTRVKPSVVDKSLRSATAEGAFMGSSNTIVNSYIIPFALALGATNIQIGLLNSARSLAETLSQIPGATLTKYASRKSIWNYSTIISKLLWVPILFLPLVGNSVLLLILLVSMSHFFTSLRAPAWASLIGDLVPQEKRGRYFGRRNMIIGIAGLITAVVIGNTITLLGFPLIFGISIVLGFLAVYFFRRIYESQFQKVYHYSHSISFSPVSLVNAVRINRNFVLLTLFLSLMGFATTIAAPFFIVYQLRELGIGYGWFTVAIAFNALVALIAQPYWGKLNDRYGDKKILAVTGILAAFIPLIWLFVTTPIGVVLAEGLGGFAWAGFDLVAFNFILALTPAEKRSSYVANHAFFKGIAVVAGAFVGGLAAQHFAKSTFLWLAGLQLIFLLSLALRLLSLSIIPKLKDAAVRESDVVPVRYILWQAVAVEPVRGLSHAMHYATQYPYRIEEIRKKIGKIKVR